MNANHQQNDGSSGDKMLRMNDWSSQFPNNSNQGVHYINLQRIEQNQNPKNILESNYVWAQQHQQQRVGWCSNGMLRREYFQRRQEQLEQIRKEEKSLKLKEKFSQCLSGDNCIRQCGISVMDQNRD